MFNNKIPIAAAQFSRFILVGIISTAVNYGVFFGLLRLFSTDYLASSATGFIVGAVFGFQLNKAWTYKSDGAVRNMLPKYLLLYIVSLFAGLLFLRATVEWIGMLPETANILTIGLTTAINFLGTKLWVFKS